MTNFDHYKETEILIKELKTTSLKNYSALLQSAMDDGATGTEIFMALRWNLNQLIIEKKCSVLVKLKANKLLKEINKALK